MKSQIQKTEKKNVTSKFKLVYLSLAALVIILGSSATSMAHTIDSTTANANIAQIKLIGAIDEDQVLFQVKYENKNQELFQLVVTDQDGYIFYEGKFQDSSFSKKFLFNKLENGSANLIFTIKTPGNNQRQSFRVNTQLVENTVITKL